MKLEFNLILILKEFNRFNKSARKVLKSFIFSGAKSVRV